MERQIRRIEAELVATKHQLSVAQNEINNQAHQISILCNALSDATSSSADCIANLQLAVYTYRDTIMNTLATSSSIVANSNNNPYYSSALITLVKDVELYVDQLNESTRLIQQKLNTSTNMQVSTMEASPGNKLGNTINKSSAGLLQPLSPYISDNNNVSLYNGTNSYVSGIDRTRIESSASSSASSSFLHTSNNNDEEIRRLRNQIASLERNFETEKVKLINTHTESLSTLAVTLKKDTLTAIARAQAAEEQNQQLSQQLQQLRKDVESELARADEEIYKTRAQAQIDIETMKKYSTEEIAKIRYEASEEIHQAHVYIQQANEETNKARAETQALRDEGNALALAMEKLISLPNNSSSSNNNDAVVTVPLQLNNSPMVQEEKKDDEKTVTMVPPVPTAMVPAVSSESLPPSVPLSAAGQATVQVLQQLSEVMSRFRPLSPLPIRATTKASMSSLPSAISIPSLSSETRNIFQSLSLDDNNNTIGTNNNADEGIQSPPPPSSLSVRPLPVISYVPGMGSINDTLSSLAAQLSILEHTHLSMPDIRSPGNDSRMMMDDSKVLNSPAKNTVNETLNTGASNVNDSMVPVVNTSVVNTSTIPNMDPMILTRYEEILQQKEDQIYALENGLRKYAEEIERLRETNEKLTSTVYSNTPASPPPSTSVTSSTDDATVLLSLVRTQLDSSEEEIKKLRENNKELLQRIDKERERNNQLLQEAFEHSNRDQELITSLQNKLQQTPGNNDGAKERDAIQLRLDNLVSQSTAQASTIAKLTKTNESLKTALDRAEKGEFKARMSANHNSTDISIVTEEKNTLQKMLESTQSQLAGTHQTIKTLEKEVSNNRQNLQVNEATITSLKEQLGFLQQQVQSTTANATEDHNNEEEQIKRLQETKMELETVKIEQVAKIDALTEELTICQNKLSTNLFRISELEQQIKAATYQRDDLQKQCNTLQQEVGSLREQARTAEEQAINARNETITMESHVHEKQCEINGFKQEVNILKEQLRSSTETITTTSKKKDQDPDDRHGTELTHQQEEITNELSSLRSRYQTLEGEKGKMEGILQTVTEQYSTVRDQFSTLQQDNERNLRTMAAEKEQLRTVQQQLDVAQKQIASLRLQAIVTKATMKFTTGITSPLKSKLSGLLASSSSSEIPNQKETSSSVPVPTNIPEPTVVVPDNHIRINVEALPTSGMKGRYTFTLPKTMDIVDIREEASKVFDSSSVQLAYVTFSSAPTKPTNISVVPSSSSTVSNSHAGAKHYAHLPNKHLPSHHEHVGDELLTNSWEIHPLKIHKLDTLHHAMEEMEKRKDAALELVVYPFGDKPPHFVPCSTLRIGEPVEVKSINSVPSSPSSPPPLDKATDAESSTVVIAPPIVAANVDSSTPAVTSSLSEKEIHQLKEALATAKTELASTKAQLSKITKRNEATSVKVREVMKSAARTHQIEHEKIKELAKHAAKDHEDEEAKIRALQSYVDGLEERIHSLTDTNTHYTEQLSRTDAEINAMKDQIDTLVKEKESIIQTSSLQLRTSVSHAHEEDQLAMAKVKELAAHDHEDEEAKIQGLQRYVSTLEQKNDRLSTMIDQRNHQLETAEDQKEKLEARLNTAKDEIALLKTENCTLLDDIQRTEETTEKDKQSSIQEFSQQLDNVNRTVTDQTGMITDLRNQMERLQPFENKVSVLQTEIVGLQETLLQLTKTNETLQHEVIQRENDLAAVRNEFQQLTEKYETLQHEKDTLVATFTMSEQEYTLSIQQQKETIEALRDEVERSQTHANACTTALEDNFKSLAVADARAVDAETKCRALEEKVQALSTVHVQNQILQDQLRDNETQIAALKVDRETARSEKAAVIAKLAELEAPKAPPSPFKNDVPNIVTSSSPSSSSLSASPVTRTNEAEILTDAALMALVGGGGRPIPSSSSQVDGRAAEDSNVGMKANDDNEDVNVQAYDTLPALRGLITILQGQLAEAQTIATTAETARDNALQRAITTESDIAALRNKLDQLTATIQGYEIKARSAEARADAAKIETESVRASLASAQALLMDCERRTAAAEATAASATENVRFVQAEKERAEMECRVLQTQLDMALTGPMTGNAAVLARQTEASKAATERLQLADISLREARTEIERLQKNLLTAEDRLQQIEEQRAIERGADAVTQKAVHASKAELSVRLAEVTAEAKALHELTTKLQHELSEARHEVREANTNRETAQMLAVTTMNDAVRALSSVLGIPVTAEMIKTGRYPITMEITGGHGSTNTQQVKEDILSREVSAAAAQLKLVTLQKSAMAKELSQVYKAVEVLENNLGRTRTENKRLHDALTETNRRLMKESANNHKVVQATVPALPMTVSPSSETRTRGIAPGVLSAMRSVFSDYAHVTTSPITNTNGIGGKRRDNGDNVDMEEEEEEDNEINDRVPQSSSSSSSSVDTRTTPVNISIRGTMVPITALSTPSAGGRKGVTMTNNESGTSSTLTSPVRSAISLQQQSNYLGKLSSSRIEQQQRLAGRK